MKKSILKQYKHYLLGGISALAFISVIHSDKQSVTMSSLAQKPLATEIVDTIPKVQSPTQTITFKNDTIHSFRSALLYYQKGRITRHYLDGNPLYAVQLSKLAHEAWHHHNKKIKYMTDFVYSSSQYTNLRMYEEISATDSEVLTADLEYKYAKNKKEVLSKYNRGSTKFYFSKIEKKEINPLSKDSADLAAKYSLIANEGNKSWCRLFEKHYTPSIKSSLLSYIKSRGFQKSHPENYFFVRSFMMTMGGVDLSQYLTEDIEFHNPVVKLYDALADVRSFNKNKALAYSVASGLFDKYPELKNINISSQKPILEHMLISETLKYELDKLRNFNISLDSTLISATYNKTMYRLSKDMSYLKFVRKFDLSFNPDYVYVSPRDASITRFISPYKFDEKETKFIKELYSYHGKDLTQYIKDFDINLLPTDFNCFSLVNFSKVTLSASNKTMMPCVSEFDNYILPQEKITNKPQTKHHFSETLYCDIPNFSEPLLVDGALSSVQEKKLKELFLNFENIPEAFKQCNADAQQEYIEQYGNPHYFETKTPYKPQNKMPKDKNEPSVQVTVTAKER